MLSPNSVFSAVADNPDSRISRPSVAIVSQHRGASRQTLPPPVSRSLFIHSSSTTAQLALHKVTRRTRSPSTIVVVVVEVISI
eukprot:8621811-Heterocapsa_arctica.AAC.1